MFSRVKAIILEHLYRLARSPDEAIDTFFWPIMDIVIWGLMSSYFNSLGGTSAGVIGFLLSGLILWNIVWRAQQDVSISLMNDIWNQNLINLFGSPLSIWEYLTATIILGFIKIFLTLGAVIFVALSLYHFNFLTLGFYLIPFFAILLAFAWSVGIIITGFIIRFGRRFQFLAWSIIVLLNPISCVYYPLSSLPKFLQQIAVFMPTTYVFESMRMVLKGKIPNQEYFIFGTILVIFWMILAVIWFNLLYEGSRKKGRLAKVEE